MGIDASDLYRPEDETAADRTLVQMANLPKNTHAVGPAWVMSHVILLPTQAGQGTFVLDTARITSRELATEIAARQLQAVVELLVARGLCPIILGDQWSACASFLTRLADVKVRCLQRVKSNWVFSRPAPTRQAGQLGASRKDGEHFQCKDDSTHGESDETWEGVGPKGVRIEVRCWNHLHLRAARRAEISLIQIICHRASGKARDPKVRAMLTLLQQLGTPARPSQLSGKAPGRAKGFRPKPRTRHAVIRKTSKKSKTSKKVISA